MKRFRRRLFNGMTVFSLLFFVATIVLAIFDFTPQGELIMLLNVSPRIEIYLNVGRLRVEMDRDERAYSTTWNQYVKPSSEWMVPWVVYYYHGPYRPISIGGLDEKFKTWPENWIFVLAFWPIDLLSAVFLVLALLRIQARHRRRRLLQENRCVVCGYDLRATPNQCPECGTVPKSPKNSG